ncbi:MAG TPA: sigma factor-like helix-turn-helix DNA-binding protein [Longimicrobiales bacterium]
MGPNDTVLIRRFLDGDERSFRALYQRHPPRLRAIVMRLLGSRKQETEDTLQDRAIERLADHQRLVLVLFDIEGFMHHDIARQPGIAVGTSKATLSRARTVLRSIMNGDKAHV